MLLRAHGDGNVNGSADRWTGSWYFSREGGRRASARVEDWAAERQIPLRVDRRSLDLRREAWALLGAGPASQKRTLAVVDPPPSRGGSEL